MHDTTSLKTPVATAACLGQRMSTDASAPEIDAEAGAAPPPRAGPSKKPKRTKKRNARCYSSLEAAESGNALVASLPVDEGGEVPRRISLSSLLNVVGIGGMLLALIFLAGDILSTAQASTTTQPAVETPAATQQHFPPSPPHPSPESLRLRDRDFPAAASPPTAPSNLVPLPPIMPAPPPSPAPSPPPVQPPAETCVRHDLSRLTELKRPATCGADARRNKLPHLCESHYVWSSRTNGAALCKHRPAVNTTVCDDSLCRDLNNDCCTAGSEIALCARDYRIEERGAGMFEFGPPSHVAQLHCGRLYTCCTGKTADDGCYEADDELPCHPLPPPLPPSPPPPLWPPATPPIRSLSAERCEALFAQPRSRFHQLWGAQGWRKRPLPDGPACWGDNGMAYFNDAWSGSFCTRNWCVALHYACTHLRVARSHSPCHATSTPTKTDRTARQVHWQRQEPREYVHPRPGQPREQPLPLHTRGACAARLRRIY